MSTRPHWSFLFFLCFLFSSSQGQTAVWQHERGQLELEGAPQRVVALNWAATEALLMLGMAPVGVADKSGYPVWVQEPELPDHVPNVGMRSSPSLEAIAELEPDLIITSGQLAPAWELLRDIAPTYVISIYDEGAQPFPRAREMLLTLGGILDRQEEAEQAIAELDRELAFNRSRLEKAGLTARPVALVNFMDARHVRVNAPNGLLQAALDGLGLENAWTEPGNFWGFSMVGLDAFGDLQGIRLVAISPVAPGLAAELDQSPFWRHLPVVRAGEIYQIDPVWAYGGVHSVKRLSRLLTEALLAGGQRNVR